MDLEIESLSTENNRIVLSLCPQARAWREKCPLHGRSYGLVSREIKGMMGPSVVSIITTQTADEENGSRHNVVSSCVTPVTCGRCGLAAGLPSLSMDEDDLLL